jgi:hypothetical protein
MSLRKAGEKNQIVVFELSIFLDNTSSSGIKLKARCHKFLYLIYKISYYVI